MSSIRQQVIAELIQRVEDISIANGYQTDAGLTLFAGTTPQLGPDDPTAAVAVLVREDSVTDQGGEVLTTLPIEIQAHAKADLDQPWLTVEAVIADIKRAVETADRSLGGLLTRDLIRGRTRALPRESGSTTIGASIEYRATCLELWGG